jgi:polyisoprenoid-binding protein YceI
MRSNVRIFACVVSVVFVGHRTVAFAESTQQRSIDPAKSTAQFTIQHIFVDRVTGTVPVLSGSVDLAAGSSIPLRVTAVLDASRINTGEPDRDSSLESPDYFDAKKFPTWTFTGTSISPSGAATFGIDGTITIHGVAQPEHFDVTVKGDPLHAVYHTVGQIDRRIFGMKGTRLDPVIGTKADVTIDITLKPEATR